MADNRPLTIDQIKAWFDQPRRPSLPKDRVMEMYFTFMPRTAFLKTLPPNAKVADIGAGDGSLQVFRDWPAPARTDIEMHAYSIEKGTHFDKFASYEISDWNVNPPEFDGRMFDAIMCAHFIEHIADPLSLVAWAQRKLVPGGRIYIEWPSPESEALPPRLALEAVGVNVMISRYADDDTHSAAIPDADAVARSLVEHGFALEARGTIRLPWLEEEMLAHFKDDADGFGRQAAYWSRTRWSQYLVAQKR